MPPTPPPKIKRGNTVSPTLTGSPTTTSPIESPQSIKAIETPSPPKPIEILPITMTKPIDIPLSSSQHLPAELADLPEFQTESLRARIITQTEPPLPRDRLKYSGDHPLSSNKKERGNSPPRGVMIVPTDTVYYDPQLSPRQRANRDPLRRANTSLGLSQSAPAQIPIQHLPDVPLPSTPTTPPLEIVLTPRRPDASLPTLSPRGRKDRDGT